jgi:hypothetical protein
MPVRIPYAAPTPPTPEQAETRKSGAEESEGGRLRDGVKINVEIVILGGQRTCVPDVPVFCVSPNNNVVPAKFGFDDPVAPVAGSKEIKFVASRPVADMRAYPG